MANRGVACAGDLVVTLGPPGLNFTALAAGAPAVGLLVVPKIIYGVVQKGSTTVRIGGRGVAHMGDPVMIPMPPELAVTGSITGTITFVQPLSGVIEQGSRKFKVDARGVAHIGDTVIALFPPTLAFKGTIAGQPFTGPLAILTPVRGFILTGRSKVTAA